MKIEPFNTKYLADVISLWEESSRIAHPFISEIKRQQEKNEIENYLTEVANSYLYWNNEELCGFISMINETIGGLFIKPCYQGKGIGRALIDYVSKDFESLSVEVFKKNKGAIEFYRKCGFLEKSDFVTEAYGEVLVVMEKIEISTVSAFKKNRINVKFMNNDIELLKYLDCSIKSASVVGVGDSMTLEELGVYDYLRNRDVIFLDKYDEKLNKDQKNKLYIKNFSSDVFLSSANAVTRDGKIVNLDGNGSRVAPIIYGPKKVIIVCGTNKLVDDYKAAMDRVRMHAAPLDAKRLGKNTPCVITGKCVECKSTDKICNYLTVVQGQFDSDRIELIFVKGSFGY